MGLEAENEVGTGTGAATPESGVNDPSSSVGDSLGDGQGANSVPDGTPTPSAETPPVTLDGMVQDHAAPLEGFDPAAHAVGADGKPVIKADGTYAKKRGRKPAQTNQPVSARAPYALPLPGAENSANAPSTNSAGGNPLPNPVTQNQGGKMSPELAAKWSANLTFNIGAMIFGHELATPSKDEKVIIPAAFKDYYDLRGSPDIPPEIGLAIAVGAYLLPRFRHESQAEKVGRIWDKIKSVFRKRENAPVSTPAKNSAEKPTEKDIQQSGAMAWGR